MSVQDNIERLKKKLQDFNDSDSKESENDDNKEQTCFDFSKNFETKISIINKSKNEHEIPSQHIVTPNKNYEDMELDSLKKYIEELLETQRKKDEIIESQSYRLEKLQQELATKIKQVNKLNSEYNMLEQRLTKTQKQSEYYEELVNDNKNNIYPAYQKLKSQYQICYLELGALENDNKIIEEKLAQEREHRAQLNQENRILQKEISQMQISKLEIKRDVEKIKIKLNQGAHDLAIAQSNLRDLKTDYDRIKNLNQVQQKKLEKYESDSNFLQKKLKYRMNTNISPIEKLKTNQSGKDRLDFSAFNDFRDLNSYN